MEVNPATEVLATIERLKTKLQTDKTNELKKTDEKVENSDKTDDLKKTEKEEEPDHKTDEFKTNKKEDPDIKINELKKAEKEEESPSTRIGNFTVPLESKSKLYFGP